VTTLKIDKDQQVKLMNHPIHYNISIHYLESQNMFEVECEFADVPKIKQIIES